MILPKLNLAKSRSIGATKHVKLNIPQLVLEKLAQSGRHESVKHKRPEGPRIPGPIPTGGTFLTELILLSTDNIANFVHLGENSIIKSDLT